MNDRPDSYYIEAVKKGNMAAFSELVVRYQDMVYSLALKLMKNSMDAEEVAQDTFVKAYQKLDSYQSKSKFSTWLYSITYNGCISELRKRRITFASIEDQKMSDEDERNIYDYFSANKKEDQDRYLTLALGQLPEDDQVLLTLYYYENQSMDEISAITDLTVSNVKIKIHRARKKVYSILQETLKEEIYNLL
jgi:RNA polymerase sigma-70 factor (ECF subfamily)